MGLGINPRKLLLVLLYEAPYASNTNDLKVAGTLPPSCRFSVALEKDVNPFGISKHTTAQASTESHYNTRNGECILNLKR